jgi:hypothetical protein
MMGEYADLVELSAELDELGGGSARLAQATVIARVRPPVGAGGSGWGSGAGLPMVQAMRDHVLLR